MLYYSSMLGFFTKKQGITLIEHERSKSVRRNESFTLIELLVVLAIIGLLISALVVYFGQPKKKANDARRKVDIQEIMKAMDLCYTDSDCGPGVYQYPVTGIAVQNIDTDKDPCYFCPVPDNLSGGDYTWIDNSADTTKYCIYTKLEAPATDTWIAASHKGIRMDLITDPSTVGIDCW